MDKVVSANAEHKSAPKARKNLWKQSEIRISVSQILELSGEVGEELFEELNQQAIAHAKQELKPQHAETPKLVAIAMDGGRIMTRAEAGRGIHQQAWKETKNACLLTMSSTPCDEDPHPELPTCFSDRSHVEKLVREIHAIKGAAAAITEASSAISVDDSAEMDGQSDAPGATLHTPPPARGSRKKWRPLRLVRTCVSSMVCSDDFGPLVAGEAQRRGFFQAPRQAFLGDGQAWNWTLHKKHFSSFTPIADFVHPLGYIYEAAKILAPADHWLCYLRGVTACWEGRVAEFIQELRDWQALQPTPPGAKLPDEDPRCVVQSALTYLEHNRPRMDYPAYRRVGLPISTSMIESQIKEINFRVKGTEKFWNRPEGAERILQVCAASLGDDDRLSQWILNRAGKLFHRSSTNREHQLAIAS